MSRDKFMNVAVFLIFLENMPKAPLKNEIVVKGIKCRLLF